MSAHTGPRKEILRVANAESDSRIEAAICRERDAKALLMMPIYRDRFVAGVLEVLFSDAHAFDDRELRSYRMMANLVEEALARDLQRSQEGAPTTQPTTLHPSVGKTPSLIQRFPSDDGSTIDPSVAQVYGAPARVTATIPTPRPPAEELTTIKRPLKRALFRDPRWSVGAATVVILLGVVWWISLHRRAAFTMEGESGIMRSKAAEKHVPKPTAATWLNESSGTQYTNAARPRFTKVQVGPNEVDYISEDVTIRHFKKPEPSSHAPSAYKQFDIGADVTVRIFNHKAAGLPENNLPRERRDP
ncbi:MAG: GAF domain-containing protein [Candidatus Acidiferrales bacterium]